MAHDRNLETHYGKTDNARRRIPITPRVLDSQENTKKKHTELEPFELYTFLHTCLTRWRPYMDPWTLAYLAGHRGMGTSRSALFAHMSKRFVPR